MSLNYSIIDSIKLLDLAFKNNMFIALLISIVLLTLILIINKDKLFVKYIVIVINIILLVFISYYYLTSIFKFQFINPINNIYFYFFNSIIYLIISTIILFKTKYKKVNYIFYGLSLINLTYALFMTYYLKCHTLIVIGNIFPMIKFGNIIYFIYYVFFIAIKFFDKKNIK